MLSTFFRLMVINFTLARFGLDEIIRRINRAINMRLSRQMHYGIRFVLGKDRVDCFGIGDVSLN